LKVRFGREFPSIVTLIGLLACLAIAAPAFFTTNNLRDVALTNVPVLLVATGMTLVIIVAEIDVSVGALFAACSVIAGTSALFLPMPLVPFIAIAAGVLLGALNGALIAWVKAPSIVVTLATMVAWREALRWGTGGAWIQNLPGNFQWFGLTQHGGEILIVSCAMAIFFLFLWGMKHLVALRVVYAIGSDKEAARLAGVSVKWVTFAVFVVLGALTGMAAILNAVRFSDVPANSGSNLELKAIAAVIVGGTPITGGRGSLAGTLVGVALLGSIGPALIFLGVNPSWEKAVQGVIILAAVVIDVVRTSHWRRVTPE
jgi:rhamnose transport system permease protein